MTKPGIQVVFDLTYIPYIEGLVQDRHNSSALAMELRLSHANPLNVIDGHR